MIRYHINERRLNEDIEAIAPGWLRRAKARIEKIRRKKGYVEKSSIWAEIKQVFMDLQYNKCAYCERVLDDPECGKIEHDLEHYRPKGGVRVWPPAELAQKRHLSYDFPLGDAWPEGYYLLAYTPFNYVAACKPCNTILKNDFFPIAGPRGQQSINPADFRDERPYLVYPLGEGDCDPNDIVGFYGYRIIPARPLDRDAFRRARITIDFFHLNRGALLWARALKIRELKIALSLRDSGQGDRNAGEHIAYLLSPRSAHTGCLRAFYRLYQDNRNEADRVYQEIRGYLNSKRS